LNHTSETGIKEFQLQKNKLNQNYSSTWEEIKHGIQQGNIFGPLLLLFYINVLPKVVNNKSIPILFADDTSILVTSTSTNKNYFQTKITANFNLINEWLGINLLSINFTKTHYVQFTTKNKPKMQIKIAYDNNQITTTSNIKFLGIYVNDTISCKHHIHYILPKLSATCYAMRIIKPYVSLESLKII
jgi:hypothetical protein